MSTTTTPSAVPPPSIPDSLARLIEHAREVDGQPPFSDGALVELRNGQKELLELDGSAAVYSATQAEFVVDPAHRGTGRGTRLLELILGRCEPTVKIWAHGDHPAARALALSHGFEATRRLLQLRMAVPDSESPTDSPRQPIDHFYPGTDDSAWLALNARSFATHPEQGSVSQADLDELVRESWFDAEDFLVLRAGTTLVGYCWLKIEGTVGEFYVVGVDPERQGAGLGRRLMTAGFARLAARGIPTAALYVEADNAPAVSLYRSLGFTEHSVDLQYARA